jgi:8-oxo-dGTP pyrophosphatase MutT (NUDIX family)
MPELFWTIQDRLGARNRTVITEPDLRRAAVLIPLYRGPGGVHVLFTRRTDTVETHKGQISFPGGSMDTGDVDPIRTALRETEEELGIPADRVRVLGVLDDVLTVVSGFVITPVVGVIPDPVTLQPSPAEIAEVIRVPLDVFRDPANLRVERRERGGKAVDVLFFTYGAHVIWGATGRIMKTLVDAVFDNAPR